MHPTTTRPLKDTLPCINYIWMTPPPIPLPENRNRGNDTDGPIAMAVEIKKQNLNNKIVFWCLDEYLEHYNAILKPQGIECRPIKIYLKRLSGGSKNGIFNGDVKERRRKIESLPYHKIIAEIAGLTLSYMENNLKRHHPSLTNQHIKEILICFLLLNESGYILDAAVKPIPERELNFKPYPHFKAAIFPYRTKDDLLSQVEITYNLYNNIEIMYAPSAEAVKRQLALFYNIKLLHLTSHIGNPQIRYEKITEKNLDVTTSRVSENLLTLFFQHAEETCPELYWETLSPSASLDYFAVRDLSVYRYGYQSTDLEKNWLDMRRFLAQNGILISAIELSERVVFKFKILDPNIKYDIGFVKLLLREKVIVNARAISIDRQEEEATVLVPMNAYQNFLTTIRQDAKKDFSLSVRKEKSQQELQLIERVKLLLNDLLSKSSNYIFPPREEKVLKQKLRGWGLVIYGIQQGLSLVEATREMEKGICADGCYEFFKEKSDLLDDSCEKLLSEIHELETTNSDQAKIPISSIQAIASEDKFVDEQRNTQLHLAVINYKKEKNLDPIKKLVSEQQADCTQQNTNGISPLHLVFAMDFPEVLELFLSNIEPKKLFNHPGYKINRKCFSALTNYYEQAQKKLLNEIDVSLAEYFRRKQYLSSVDKLLLQSFPSLIKTTTNSIAHRFIFDLDHPRGEIKIAFPDKTYAINMCHGLDEQIKYNLLPVCFGRLVSKRTQRLKIWMNLNFTPWSYRQHWHQMFSDNTVKNTLQQMLDKFELAEAPPLDRVGLENITAVQSVLMQVMPIRDLCQLILDYYSIYPGSVVQIPQAEISENFEMLYKLSFQIPAGFNFQNAAITLLQAYLQTLPLPDDLVVLNDAGEITEVVKPVTLSKRECIVLALPEQKNDKTLVKTTTPFRSCSQLVLYFEKGISIIVPNPYYWDLQLSRPPLDLPLTKKRLGYPEKPAKMLSLSKSPVENNMHISNSTSSSKEEPKTTESSSPKKAPTVTSPQLAYTGKCGADNILLEAKENNPSSRNLWQILLGGVQPTLADGSCAFHAVLGEWDMKKQHYRCVNVRQERKDIAAAIRSCTDEKSQLYHFAKLAITEMVMNGTYKGKPNSKLANLILKYQEFQKKNQQEQDDAWKNLEKKLLQNEAINQKLRAAWELNKAAWKQKWEMSMEPAFEDARTKRNAYAYCIKTDPAFKALVLSIGPEAVTYNVATHKSEVFWEKTNYSDIIPEYADFIENPANYLLPIELNIIAHFKRITIQFYNGDRAQCDTYNPGQDKTVAVRFNGRDHFERYVPSPIPQQNNKETADSKINDTQISNEDPAFAHAKELLRSFSGNENIRKLMYLEVYEATCLRQPPLRTKNTKKIEETIAKIARANQILQELKNDFAAWSKQKNAKGLFKPRGFDEQEGEKIKKKIQEKEDEKQLTTIALLNCCYDEDVYLEFINSLTPEILSKEIKEDDIADASDKTGVSIALAEILGMEIFIWQPDTDKPGNLKLAHHVKPGTSKIKVVKHLFQADGSAGYVELKRNKPKELAKELPKEKSQELPKELTAEMKTILKEKIKAQFRPLANDLRYGIQRLYTQQPELIDGNEYKALKPHPSKDGVYDDLPLIVDGSQRRIGYAQDIEKRESQQDAVAAVSLNIDFTWLQNSGKTYIDVSTEKAFRTLERTIYCKEAGTTLIKAAYYVVHNQKENKRYLHYTVKAIGDSVPVLIRIKPAPKAKTENSEMKPASKNPLEAKIEEKKPAKFEVKVNCLNLGKLHNTNNPAEIDRIQKEFAGFLPAGQKVVTKDEGGYLYHYERGILEAAVNVTQAIGDNHVIGNNHTHEDISSIIELEPDEIPIILLASDFIYVKRELSTLEANLRQEAEEFFEMHFESIEIFKRDVEKSLTILAQHFIKSANERHEKMYPDLEESFPHDNASVIAGIPVVEPACIALADGHGAKGKEIAKRTVEAFLRYFLLFAKMEWALRDSAQQPNDLLYNAILQGNRDTISDILGSNDLTPQQKKDTILAPVAGGEGDLNCYQLALYMALNAQLEIGPDDKQSEAASKSLEIFTLLNQVLFPPNASYAADPFAYPSTAPTIGAGFSGNNLASGSISTLSEYKPSTPAEMELSGLIHHKVRDGVLSKISEFYNTKRKDFAGLENYFLVNGHMDLFENSGLYSWLVDQLKHAKKNADLLVWLAEKYTAVQKNKSEIKMDEKDTPSTHTAAEIKKETPGAIGGANLNEVGMTQEEKEIAEAIRRSMEDVPPAKNAAAIQLSANGVTLAAYKPQGSPTEEQKSVQKTLSPSEQEDEDFAKAIAVSMQGFTVSPQPNNATKSDPAKPADKLSREKQSEVVVVKPMPNPMDELVPIIKSQKQSEFDEWFKKHVKPESDICQFKTEDGDTMLHIAVGQGIQAVEFLFRSTAITDLNWEKLKNTQNYSLMIPSVLAGDEKRIKNLLAQARSSRKEESIVLKSTAGTSLNFIEKSNETAPAASMSNEDEVDWGDDTGNDADWGNHIDVEGDDIRFTKS